MNSSMDGEGAVIGSMANIISVVIAGFTTGGAGPDDAGLQARRGATWGEWVRASMYSMATSQHSSSCLDSRRCPRLNSHFPGRPRVWLTARHRELLSFRPQSRSL